MFEGWVNIPEWWVNIKQNSGSTWSRIYSNEPPTPEATCKLKTITYNFSQSQRIYSVAYSGDNISELTSSVDKTQYSYNSAGQLTKKETSNSGNTQVQFKTEFSYDGSEFLVEEKTMNYLVVLYKQHLDIRFNILMVGVHK